jgi:hypothetical protein
MTPTRGPFEVVSAAFHAALAWTFAAAATPLANWKTTAPDAALSAHAVVLPIAVLLVAFVYFRRAHPLRPPAAGAVFGVVVLVLDIAVHVLLPRAFDLRAVLLGTALPSAATFVGAWLSGIASELASPSARPR